MNVMSKKKKIQFKKFSTLKKELLKDLKVKKAYDELEPEYTLISALIEKRIKENLTQKELAEKIGTTQSAISRFELGEVSPRLDFLKKVAKAVGAKIKVV